MHGLNAPTGEVAPFKENLNADTVQLPPPALPGVSLASAIAGRTSCRQFRSEPIPLAQLGVLRQYVELQRIQTAAGRQRPLAELAPQVDGAEHPIGGVE